MDITDGVEIADLGLYLKKEKILIFSDFHIGYEEALSSRGILIPQHQFKDTKERLQTIFDNLKGKIKTIVITGDLKHEFGRINQQEWSDVTAILHLMSKHCEKIILLKGNHDTILEPIAVKSRLKIQNNYRIGDFAILHGDVIPEDSKVLDKKIIIIGHEHPAVKLTDSFVSEKVKCFLKGKWKGKVLIVVPSFNLVTEGTDILSDRLLSPFLHQNLSNFEIFAVPEADKVMYFGKVKNLVAA